LDEVGEIPYPLQGKLLRVLQEREFERVGEEVTRRVDVRILAATNRDLKKEIEEGRFRRDLFYRLNVFPIEVVPLRQRSEDIPFLAVHFLKQAVATLGCPRPRLTKADIVCLQQYEWPGNVRELRNVIERAVIASRGGELRLDLSGTAGGEPPNAAAPSPPLAAPNGEILPDAEIKRLERDNILAALEQARWKIYGPGGAAELLGIRPTTLASRIRRLKLAKPHPA
jgi:transcriptional regulator with GAF, ATPase, and Fis domain